VSKTRKEKIPKLVYIVWEDAWRSDNLYSTEELNKDTKPFLVQEVGFLVCEDKNTIRLASSKNQNPVMHWKHVSVIPKSLIRYRKVVT